MNHVRARAMNCDVDLFDCGRAAEDRLARCESWLHAFEARFSRFLSASEVTRLNLAAGDWTPASPMLFDLLRLSLELARRSDGLFDPTVLRSLEGAGYDQSFDDLRTNRRTQPVAPGSSAWRSVDLDPTGPCVRLPAEVGIDFGGIGKGWAVDRLARYLQRDCLINAGGDLYAAGAPDDHDSWLVGIQNPFEPSQDIMTLAVNDRGVATSSVLYRRWIHDGQAAHHLIDPRTQASARSNAVQVTAVAACATLAEHHAKVALLQGVSVGLDYLESESNVEGVLVAKTGDVLATSGVAGLKAGSVPSLVAAV